MEENREPFITRKAGYILDNHCLGAEVEHESKDVQHKVVAQGVATRAREAAESLAGRTSLEDVEFAALQSEKPPQAIGDDAAHVSSHDDIGMVGREGLGSVVVVLRGCEDDEPSVPQPLRGSACTSEEINRCPHDAGG
nr:hypothetical protein [Tetrasphaera sp. F2B08]